MIVLSANGHIGSVKKTARIHIATHYQYYRIRYKQLGINCVKYYQIFKVPILYSQYSKTSKLCFELRFQPKTTSSVGHYDNNPLSNAKNYNRFINFKIKFVSLNNSLELPISNCSVYLDHPSPYFKIWLRLKSKLRYIFGFGVNSAEGLVEVEVLCETYNEKSIIVKNLYLSQLYKFLLIL